MRVTPIVICLLVIVAGASASELEAYRPLVKHRQIVVDSADFAARGEMPYLAFPALLRTKPDEILISYKRGRSHALDSGAVLETICFNTTEKQVVSRAILGNEAGKIHQCGEWVVFPNGRMALLSDVQMPVVDGGTTRHHRTGIELVKSDDGGRTFSGMQKLGAVDGVEYGYAFEAVVSEGSVYLLAMSFPEMSASKSVLDAAGKRVYGQVSVLVSADNGEAWRHVRNLSQEFGGIAINESSFVVSNEGFLVCTRGYDGKARLHQVDKEIRLLRQVELTKTYAAIRGVIGRPRLFVRDGRMYLLGRNTDHLALFRIDPDELTVERWIALDPDPGDQAGDAYYAVPYFEEHSSGTLLNVITYRKYGDRPNPDVVRLEYRWAEVH